MRECPYPIGELLMHRSPMLLLDGVVGYDDSAVTVSVTIRESSLFLTPEGVPGHIALEYMAQACGAYAGIMARTSGDPVRIGLLLGTRECRVMVPYFRLGDRLLITASLVLHDENLAAFDCKVELDDRLVAEAQLKVFQATDDLLRPG